MNRIHSQPPKDPRFFSAIWTTYPNRGRRPLSRVRPVGVLGAPDLERLRRRACYSHIAPPF